ncbi:MAG: lytic transglycosylase domain-containing protein [Pseudomonadota bacterium]
MAPKELQVMNHLARLAALMLLALGCAATAALAERPRPLGWALDAMRAGNWDNAARIAARDGPVAADIIEWHRLRAGRGSYDAVTAFLDRRPNWPGEAALRRRAEPAVISAGPEAVLRFFADTPAATARGILAHAAALSATGQSGEAEANIVLAWRTLPMGASDQQSFLDAHATLLKLHHVARLDAMLWARERDAARAMFDLVPADQQALARARIALQLRLDTVTALIRAVPAALQDHPGLAHDRFEWRVRAGNWDDAKALLEQRSQMENGLGVPQAWANRRRALARDEMRDGAPARAYMLAAAHGLVEGSAYADLEWLAGYIALRYLDDPDTALAHFQNHGAAVRSPISRGRAGYWIGRAHEAAGRADAAAAAYADGAQFQTSFYGLLAAERGGLPPDPDLDGAENFGDWRLSDLARRDLFEAGMLLQASGEMTLAERFWTHLAEDLGRSAAGQLGQAALDMDQPHLAVMIGKRVARRGLTIHAAYYPLHPLAEADLPMSADMNLAIARRESEFDPVVQSGAGARGLMQIMPATGREVARRLGRAEEHTTDRMITDPVYNAELGAAYLSQMAARYAGNVVLMSVAYNAGPGRADRWQELYGDPRNLPQNFDIVDWIEHIPFRETRNYVMRVTESLPVYRARLSGDPLPVPFTQELSGNSLLPFAPPGE